VRRLTERLAVERLRESYPERKENQGVNTVTIRLLFTAAFGLVALGGAILLECMGHGSPEWLIAVVGAAAGYVFGHVQANGFHGK